MNIHILTFETIDSTNTEALKQARLGVDEGLCIIAREQTAGRGRRQRTWVSEKDAGLYFSIVLRPKIENKFLPLITLMAGVSVHATLVEYGLKPDIKWVNDIHISGKKISGILAETTDTDDGIAVVAGIGINIQDANFAPGVFHSATSLKSETGRDFEPSEVAEKLIAHIRFFYDVLHRDNGPAEIIAEWRRRSSYYSGKPVRVVVENDTIIGITDGLELTGALRVRRNDGSLTIVQAGDVEQLRSAS